MPLESGSSRAAVSRNIATEREAGKPEKQAAAIALAKARSDDAGAIRAAGILFVTPDGQALFLKRGADGDMPGAWCFPGGTTEGDETAEETAKRETVEEIGSLPDGARLPWVRTVSQATPASAEAAAVTPPAVDFTTFLQKVPAPFEPKLNAEHSGFAWAPIGEPPEPLHPGCRVALQRFTMDELGIARAIAAGQLTSPQRYQNVSLFDLRITGTGVAYRRAARGDDGKVTREAEFTYRRPENYLTEEFLARCNGLAVLMLHPKKAVLSSDEFAMRAIGAVMLPYIKGDEVWGIAKIYDDDAIKALETTPLSTSPGVILGGDNLRLQMEDGSPLLIEGRPALVDHVAICERGVWDKGGEPSGVNSIPIGDSAMTDEEKKAAAEKAKADADAGQKLDKMLSCLDSLTKRMDAYDEEKKAVADKARKDAEEAEAKKKADAEEEEKKKVADKARKDEEEAAAKKKADEDAEAKKKADAASGIADVRADIKRVEALLPKQLSDADYAAMADAQARADAVFSAFGGSAPRPLDGETLVAYKRRLATKLKDHSPTWKGVDLAAIADSTAFGIAETQIYADAMSAAMNPTDLPADQLRAIVTTDTTGRRITTFAGRPSAWMSGFSGHRRRLVGIRNSSDR